ncbi:MAG TPA: 2-phospho-L-lactate transferase [Clostridia bacterium]|nr:2-phospho-L-lactate transferase [Clostridia bacterium]
MWCVLSGGVGGARFIDGLTSVLPPDEITVIGNTGDDIEFFGLHICPDIDIVLYTILGVVDEEKGWGLKGDTFKAESMLKALGEDQWFHLGDGDLALSLYRTFRLGQGLSLTEVTREIASRLGAGVKILPATDHRIETRVITASGEDIHFEEYFVKRQCRDTVKAIRFDTPGCAVRATATGEVVEAIRSSEGVILAPSNPFVSIGCILAVEPIRDLLRRKDNGPVVAISPIVGGEAIKGPAARMLAELGMEPSALAVAQLYEDFLDGFVMDLKDETLKEPVERLGIRCLLTDTIMRSRDARAALARATLEFARCL